MFFRPDFFNLTLAITMMYVFSTKTKNEMIFRV
jgi:hypothetical protein